MKLKEPANSISNTIAIAALTFPFSISVGHNLNTIRFDTVFCSLVGIILAMAKYVQCTDKLQQQIHFQHHINHCVHVRYGRFEMGVEMGELSQFLSERRSVCRMGFLITSSVIFDWKLSIVFKHSSKLSIHKRKLHIVLPPHRIRFSSMSETLVGNEKPLVECRPPKYATTKAHENHLALCLYWIGSICV